MVIINYEKFITKVNFRDLKVRCKYFSLLILKMINSTIKIKLEHLLWDE